LEGKVHFWNIFLIFLQVNHGLTMRLISGNPSNEEMPQRSKHLVTLFLQIFLLTRPKLEEPFGSSRSRGSDGLVQLEEPLRFFSFSRL
jgi:hypothetical protein